MSTCSGWIIFNWRKARQLFDFSLLLFCSVWFSIRKQRSHFFFFFKYYFGSLIVAFSKSWITVSSHSHTVHLWCIFQQMLPFLPTFYSFSGLASYHIAWNISIHSHIVGGKEVQKNKTKTKITALKSWTKR